MLESHTIKAILEGMLFTSDKPVTLKQMAARVRTVVRRSRVEGAASEATDVAEFVSAAEALSELSDEILGVSASVTEIFTAPSAEMPAADDAEEVDVVRAALLQKSRELEDDVPMESIKENLFSIEEELRASHRGIELVQVAKGYQLRTKPEVAAFLRDDKKAPPLRLSPSSLETLAIVAYEQPAPKHKIEDIRGVDCGGVLKTLLDRDFVRIIGRSEEPGRPIVYGTTAKFLEVFGLNSLKDLPDPADFQELAAATSADDGAPEADPVDGNLYVHAVDFENADEFDLSESERAILDELDQSLAGLKDVEKGIEALKPESAKSDVLSEPGQNASPTPSSETV